MRRIAVLTRDTFLYKKIALSLPSDNVVLLEDTEGVSGFDAVFSDLDDFPIPPIGAVTVSRVREADLSVPFSLDAPARLIDASVGCYLVPSRKAAVMLGEEIILTELEYELFSLIVHSEEAVSREAILREVWHGTADAGIVNVYVHYLREKLEGGGERVIVSSRGRGYSLSEKYRAAFKKGVR